MTEPNRAPSMRRLRWLYPLLGTCLVAGILMMVFGHRASPEASSFDRDPSVTALLDAADAGTLTSVTYYETTGEVLAERTSGPNLLVDVPEAMAGPFLEGLVEDDVEVSVGHGTPAAPVSAETANGDNKVYGFGSLLLFLGAIGLIVTALFHASARGSAKLAREQAEAAKSAVPDVPSTRFTDVAGAAEAVADLQEMVDYLKDPARFTRLGAKPPRGALLVGPPGTGKTLLARAVAGEAGVPFFAVAGSDFVEKYVGVGAQRMRDLFAKARGHEKAIVFIDEIDAVGRRRSNDDQGSHVESENTLVALLAELDGFNDRGNILILGATNRSDVLDSAVTRPGRLDRKVEVPNPDRRGREQILAVHARNRPVASDVDLEGIARRTPGFSGAQLEAVVNEACMVAARTGADAVTAECFDFAVATVAMGRARESALVTEHDREVTAWHEAGHTAAAFLIPEADDPVQVTIVPRGPAGGVTWMAGSDDIFLSRRKAHAQLVVALAGRAGEEMLLDGEYTQGAHGDLTSATDIAVRMTTQYGMTRLGYQVRNNPASEAVSAVVEELLVDAHTRAVALLEAHRPFMAALAAALLEDETLPASRIARLAAESGVRIGPEVELPPVPTQVGPDRKDDTAPDAVVVPFPDRRSPGVVLGPVPAADRAASPARSRTLRALFARRNGRPVPAPAPAD